MKKGNGITLGVLLSDEPDWREQMTADPTLDRFVEPRDALQLLGYLKRLQQRGVRIRKLVLTGHGSYSPTVGMIVPEDLDQGAIRTKRANVLHDIDKLRRELAASTGTQEDRDALATRLTAHEQHYERLTRQEHLIDDVGDVMAPGAQVELRACRQATYGMRLMTTAARVLLRRNGGELSANLGDVTIRSNNLRKLGKEVLGPDYKFKVSATDEWVTLRCPPAGSVPRGRCGEPCRDFDRYGFCDNPRSADGGPCHLHR